MVVLTEVVAVVRMEVVAAIVAAATTLDLAAAIAAAAILDLAVALTAVVAVRHLVTAVVPTIREVVVSCLKKKMTSKILTLSMDLLPMDLSSAKETLVCMLANSSI